MVKLRLRRKGKKGYAVYDIVAVDSRGRRDGAYLEKIGFYNPNTEISTFNFQHDRAIYWLNVGAQPTDIVGKLLSYDGVLLHRALLSRGMTEEAIAPEIEKHREIVRARYIRRKQLRIKRKENKIRKAAEEAAAAAKTAENTEVEAPAEA